MTDQVMQHCKKCGIITMHLRPSTSHILHLLLSVITFGAWLIVWFFVALNNASQSQCSSCGALRGLFGSTSGGNRSLPKIQPEDYREHNIEKNVVQPKLPEAAKESNPLLNKPGYVSCRICLTVNKEENEVCRHCSAKL